ncbi:MAG: SAM-dependent methyltransferase [Acidimicrobiaceae bacterium]|nr:SAM-dependent methyltransferase [Acidimicrobiaceae bacterium]
MTGATEQWSEANSHSSIGLGDGNPFRRLLGKMLWPFLRHQVVVNRALLAETESLAQRLDAVEFQLARARGDIEHHTATLVRHEEPLDRHEFLLKHLEPAFLDLQRAVDLVHDKVDLGQRQAFARYYEGIGPIRTSITELSQRLADLEGTAENQRSGAQRALSDVWLRLSQLDLYLSEARRSFPEAPPSERLARLPSGVNGIYPVLEEAFRGPVPVVEERVRSYVAELVEAARNLPVVDLGCGRGELLSLLQEAGAGAYGVDVSEAAVARCVGLGLDVRQEEARSHLATLADRSVGAITGIQLVEHLPIDELVELLDQSARVLAPGGLLVLESPNPENLVVASSSFLLDPTRVRPIPPALLEFLIGSRGFDRVQVRRFLRPEQALGLPRPKPEEPWSEALTPLVDAVNFHLFGPADYAVVARRP